jgi:hypothetical protein
MDFSISSIGSSFGCTQLDVLTIEAHMLFPNDEVARNEARTTSGIEFANRHRHLLPDDFFKDLFQIAANAKPLKVLQKASQPLFTRGIIVGAMLHHALGSAEESTEHEARPVHGTSPHRSLNHAVKALSKALGPKYSPQTINSSVWPEFRKVSHYWAAHISECFEGRPAFPSTVEWLPLFLAKAEVFRELGEKTRTWKSPKSTILSPGECLRLPCCFQLPTLAGQPEFFVFSKAL